MVKIVESDSRFARHRITAVNSPKRLRRGTVQALLDFLFCAVPGQATTIIDCSRHGVTASRVQNDLWMNWFRLLLK